MEITYNQVITELFNRRPGRRSNCTLMGTILLHYNNPHLTYPVVHVAGTNGKGSVCVKLAHTLEQAGYRVGLYISPHLFDFTERISINGKNIPQKKVIEYYLDLKQFLQINTLEPNFFEVTTCFGFRYFQEEKVDIAIIEVGIGGKCDSTNVVNPILSVITSISFDHTEILGTSLEEIAEQKAGIIKASIPVVVGPRAQYSSIFKRAQEVNALTYVVEDSSTIYEEENKAIVKKAVTILKEKFPLKDEHIEKGLNYKLPCRFERRGNCIYDVAHNPDGFARLKENLNYFFPKKTFRFLIGMSDTKDINKCLEEIANHAHHVHFVQAKVGHGTHPSKLKVAFEKLSNKPCSIEESVSEGMLHAKNVSKKDELLIVCGSFYIMSEAYEHH